MAKLIAKGHEIFTEGGLGVAECSNDVRAAQLTERFNAFEPGGLVDKYRALHNVLSDMVEGGRLKETDIPDDYKWLVAMLVELVGLDPETHPLKEAPTPKPDLSEALALSLDRCLFHMGTEANRPAWEKDFKAARAVLAKFKGEG